jgi:hypothetical protein
LPFPPIEPSSSSEEPVQTTSEFIKESDSSLPIVASSDRKVSTLSSVTPEVKSPVKSTDIQSIIISVGAGVGGIALLAIFIAAMVYRRRQRMHVVTSKGNRFSTDLGASSSQLTQRTSVPFVSGLNAFIDESVAVCCFANSIWYSETRHSHKFSDHYCGRHGSIDKGL